MRLSEQTAGILTKKTAVAVLFYMGMFIYAGIASAVPAGISGTAPEYAGYVLELYRPTDGISGHTERLCSDTVAANGSFRLVFDTDETFLGHIGLGFYDGTLFVEPGKYYSVNLPEKTDVRRSDMLNPYFKPEEILLSMNDAGENDLNILITSFEDDMDVLWNTLLFEDDSRNAFDAAHEKLENKYGNSGNAFFNDYRKFSYALLLCLYGNKGRDIAISSFLLPEKPQYGNPAFWQALSALTENFRYIEYLKSNRELYDLALLQNVSTGHLPTAWLDSVQTGRTIEIATKMKHAIGKTEKGRQVGLPYLINISGDTLRWENFHEPYIYVCFANSDFRESLSDIEFVRKLKARWKSNFAFVFVFAFEDKSKTAATCTNYPQKEYICNTEDNPDVLDAFGVRIPPSYFVLTNQGRFEISPATAPAYFEP